MVYNCCWESFVSIKESRRRYTMPVLYNHTPQGCRMGHIAPQLFDPELHATGNPGQRGFTVCMSKGRWLAAGDSP